MAKDHDHGQDDAVARLLVEIRNVLSDTERRNETRHVELVAALGCKSDILARLTDLKSRLSQVAKAMAALDART